MKTPLTRQRIRHHLTYCGWMYVLLILVASFGWNIIYTTTAPRTPAEEKIDFYVTGASSDAALAQLMQQAHAEAFPEMKEMQHVMILGSSNADYTGTMQLYTYLYAGEGDVYLLKREDFRNYAGPALMLPLEDLVADGTLKIPEGMNINKGYVTLSADFEEMAGERHLYGIPCESLTGFKEKLNIDPQDKYLIVTAKGGNLENAMKFVQYLIDTMQ